MIIIDPLQEHHSKWSARTRWYAHMGSTVHTLAGLGELHAFALRLGMREEWFQDTNKRHPHYDLTRSRRELAVQFGAVELSQEDFLHQVTWTPHEIADRYTAEMRALLPDLEPEQDTPH